MDTNLDRSSLWSFNLICLKLYPFRHAEIFSASGRKALVVGVELIGVVVQYVEMSVIVGVEAIASVIITIVQQVLIQIVTMRAKAQIDTHIDNVDSGIRPVQ